VEADEVTSCQQFCERRRARREHIHRKALGAARDSAPDRPKPTIPRVAPCTSAPFHRVASHVPHSSARTSARQREGAALREHQRKRKVRGRVGQHVGRNCRPRSLVPALASRSTLSFRRVVWRSLAAAGPPRSRPRRSGRSACRAAPRVTEASDQLLTRRRGITVHTSTVCTARRRSSASHRRFASGRSLPSSGFSRNLRPRCTRRCARCPSVVSQFEH